MKSENNGKIAIAIVAMFVVALSVVGFTYAYFTASVARNQDEKTTEVTAGMLEVNYTQNKTMTAQKVIPGWESDGLHYFGTETVDGELRTKSLVATDDKDVTTKGLTAADGITKPAAFNVASTARSTGKSTYVIKLIDITNGIAAKNAADAANLTYELYSVNAADTYTGGTLVTSGELPATGEDKVISKVVEIDKNVTQYYYLMLKYADTAASQNDSQAANIKATVKVVGVTTNDSGATYIDAEGNPVTPAA